MTSSDSWPEPTNPEPPVYTPPGSTPVPPTSGLPGFTQPPPIPTAPHIPSPVAVRPDGAPAAPAETVLAAGLALITAVLLVVAGVLEELFSFGLEFTLVNLASPVALVIVAVLALIPGTRERVGGLLLGIGLAVLCFDVGSRLAFLVTAVRLETFLVALATVLCLAMAALGGVWSRSWPGAGATLPIALIGGALVALGRVWFESQFGFSFDAALSFVVLYGVGGPLIALVGGLHSRSAALLTAGVFGVVLTGIEMTLGFQSSELVALGVVLIGFGMIALTGFLRLISSP